MTCSGGGASLEPMAYMPGATHPRHQEEHETLSPDENDISPESEKFVKFAAPEATVLQGTSVSFQENTYLAPLCLPTLTTCGVLDQDFRRYPSRPYTS